jgi:hypothetical protein
VADPTVVPPVEQLDGGLDCGPNTLNVTVPEGEEPPDNGAEIDAGAIFVPSVTEEGALTGPSDGDAGWIDTDSVARPDETESLFESEL